MNVTLVAYYGEKPSEVKSLILEAQAVLRTALGARGCPDEALSTCRMDQVHATVIGLEGLRIPGSNHVVNTHYMQLRQLLKLIRLTEALELLRQSPLLPMTIRVCGYRDGGPYPFTSRGQHPYARPFSFQGEIAAAMGWPLEDNRYPMGLGRLRRSLNKANILHKYHAALTDVDNDFFFVLGRISRAKIDENTLQAVQDQLRDFMAARTPIDIVVDRANLHVVGYVDQALPTESSIRYPISIDAGQLVELYRHAA